MVRVPYWRARSGVGHDLLDFLDAGKHGGKLDELGLGDVGDDLGERGLAGAGRAPENHRSRVVALDLHAQRFAGADQVLLADEFVERAGTHAIGERTGAVVRWLFPRERERIDSQNHFTTETQRHGEKMAD